MMKLPIGVVIKSIIDEKRIKVADIAGKMGLTRQAIYHSYAKQDMSEGELARWTVALGVQEGEINKRWENALNDISASHSPTENNYLLEHLTLLEDQFKRLLSQMEINNKQIEVKDRQIEGLQKTVEVLLGKSEDVMILMATLAKPNQPKLKAATA